MDALKLLKDDHDRVDDLFRKVGKSEDEKQKLQLFKDIKQELDLHARLEETIFYPACQKYDELRDMILEGFEEHKQVKTLLHEIDTLNAKNERVKAKLTVLQENVEHHVGEEEHELFPKVRKLMSAEELDRLGDQLMQAKGRRAAQLP